MDTSKSHGDYIPLNITVTYDDSSVNRITTLLTFCGGAAYIYLSDIHYWHLSTLLGLLYSRQDPVLLHLTIIITSSMAVGPTLSSSGPTPHLSLIGRDFLVHCICCPYPEMSHLCATLLATLALPLVGVGGVVKLTASRPPDRSPSYWIAEQISIARIASRPLDRSPSYWIAKQISISLAIPLYHKT